MNKVLFLFLLPVCALAQGTRISQLPTSTNLSNGDIFVMSAYTNGATNIGGSSVDETFYSTRYTNTWEFSTTLRLGWGNFGLFGTYNLTPVFKSGQGPSLTPFSAGMCMTGL